MAGTIAEYGFIRVASVSPEIRLADVDFNITEILKLISDINSKECHFMVFPELSLTGYTCGDLFYQDKLLTSALNSLEKIAEKTRETSSTVVIGAPVKSDGRLYNCAIVISNGEIKGIIPKTYLCNTNEYYEERWFASEFNRQSDFVIINGREIPFGADLLFTIEEMPDCVFGVEICEDLWAVIPPSCGQAIAGANLLLNLSASNETLGKNKYRRELVLSQSARCLSAYIYSSAGPGESSTDLVFPGICLISEYGYLLAETKRFEFSSQYIISDIDIQRLNNERLRNNAYSSSASQYIYRKIPVSVKSPDRSRIFRNINPQPFIPFNNADRDAVCREIFSIQVTALAKRLRHIGLKNVVLGISGGLDSTLALLVCIKAFGKLGLDKIGIHAVTMPGFGTTEETRENAKKLTELLSVSFSEINICQAVENHLKDISCDINIRDIVYENAQARERTQILMDLANKVNGLVVGTGDLSELALGWCTYSGDHISMYSVNSGIPKTLIKYVIQWCSDSEFSGQAAGILKKIIETPISPELLPPDKDGKISQKTESEIGPYILHDFFLFYFLRHNFSPEKILFLAKTAFDGQFSQEEIAKWLKVFYERFFANQFKRSCMPDGVKVGSVALSPRGDWRMPSDASASLWMKI